jgi:hypothetical protein
MQRLEVSGAVRPLKWSLGVKWLMDTIEKYYIDKETQMSNEINDRNTVKPNIIFDTIVQ